MGGEVGGERIASSLACKTIKTHLQECPKTESRAVLARNLRSAVRQANQEVCGAAAADKSLRGMGTTVSAAAIVGNTAVLAQVGDSRAYVLRGSRLTQITRDQSVVSALVQSGQLSEERAPYSMQRGRVLQALGHEPDVDVSLSIAELRWGDRLLLSSDGLHEFVSHDSITEAAGLEGLGDAADALIELAMQAGGADNISVILAELRGDELAKPLAGDDELRFTELDPSLDGEMALSTTSMVARRLAHKAGLRKDGWPLAIPATSQHPVVSGERSRGRRRTGLCSREPDVRGGLGPYCICCGGRRILCPLVALTLVIDYLSGAQRGQRQVLELAHTVTFGRHPDNIVSFDARADIDASSRHAELVVDGACHKILDVGSSNGTWIAGKRVQEQEVEIGGRIGGGVRQRGAPPETMARCGRVTGTASNSDPRRLEAISSLVIWLSASPRRCREGANARHLRSDNESMPQVSGAYGRLHRSFAVCAGRVSVPPLRQSVPVRWRLRDPSRKSWRKPLPRANRR